MRLTRQEYEELKRRHPNLCPDLGAVAPVERKQSAPDVLDKGSHPQRKRTGCVELIITIIAFRPRCLDDDNSISGGTKALRDAIAATLGCDDGDKRLRWQYGQVQTNGEPGCLVRIERVK